MERYKIPENIPLRTEFWRGFGKKEAVITGVIMAIVVPLGIIYAKLQPDDPTATFKAVAFVGLTLFAAVASLTKNSINQSILDLLMNVRRFKQTQQAFYYQSKEELYAYTDKEEKAA